MVPRGGAGRTNPVSAIRDCKSGSHRVSALHDHQKGRRIKTLKACMVLLGVGGLLAFGAYQFTDNLSTAIIIFAITVGLIFVAHPIQKYFLFWEGQELPGL